LADEGEAPEGWPSRAGRYAFWTVIVLMASLSSVAYHVATDEGGRVLAVELNAWVHREVEGEIRVRHIRAEGFDEVTVSGIEVRGTDGEVVARLARLHLVVDATTLGDDVLQVEEIALEELWVSARRRGDELALVEALEPVGPTESRQAPLRVDIDRLSLLGGVVVDLPRRHAIEGAELVASSQDGTLSIESATAELRRDEETLARLARLSGRINPSGRSEVDVRVEAGESWVEGTSALTRDGDTLGAFEGELELSIREDTLESLVESDAATMLGTDVVGTLAFNGVGDVGAAEATIETAGGSLRAEVERDADVTIVRAASDSLNLGAIVDGPDLGELAGALELRVARAEADEARRVALVATDLRYDAATVPAASLEAVLAEDHLIIERLAVPHWTEGGGHLSLTGRVGFDRSADLSLSANLPGLASDENVQRAAPGLRGAVEAELELEVTGGDASTMDVEGRLSATRATVGATHVARLAVEGRASGTTRAPEVELRIDGTGIRGESISVRSTRLALTGGPDEYALRGRTRLDGGRSVDVDLVGARGADALDVEGSATLSGVLAAPLRFDVRGLSMADDDTVTLGELAISGAGVDAVAVGTYRPETSSELDLTLRSLDVSTASGSSLVRGQAAGELHASGTFGRPEVEVEARLADAAVGPMHAPEVTLSAGLSTADRSARVEAAGDFEGYGRMQLSATAILARAGTTKRRVEKASWDVDARLEDVPLTLAMLLSPDLPPWDGTLTATVSLDGVLPTPKTHVEARATGFSALGSDPIDADVRFDFDAPRGEAVVRLADRRGPLATLSGRGRVDPAALRPPLERRRIAEAASWEVSFSVPTRRIDRLPRPLAREVALSAAIEGRVSRVSRAAPTGTARIRLSRYDEGERPEGCRYGGLTTAAFDVELGPRTRVTFDASTTGRTMARGELSAETPLGRWLADGFPESSPPVALTAHAEGIDLSTVPGICESVSGTVMIDVNGTSLLTPRPRARVRVRSTDLVVGELDPFAASLDARAYPGGFRAEAGVTSGEHRARLHVTGPLRFEGIVPQRPRRLDVEQLVYRSGGGSAEMTGRATLRDGPSGHVVLDGPIRRLLLMREGEPAGRLNAHAHVEAAFSPERRELTARFTGATFTLPPRTPPTREERRRQREARREAREARVAGRRRPPTIPERAPAGEGVRTRIVLDATEPFWVRRSDMRLKLSTRLLVDLGRGEPRLRGRIDVHEGRMDAVVGHYDIADGFIAFWGGGAEPEMHLRGTFLNRRGERRRVSLFGPLGAPEIRIE